MTAQDALTGVIEAITERIPTMSGSELHALAKAVIPLLDQLTTAQHETETCLYCGHPFFHDEVNAAEQTS